MITGGEICSLGALNLEWYAIWVFFTRYSRTHMLTQIQNTQQHPNSVTMHLCVRHSNRSCWALCSILFLPTLICPILSIVLTHPPPLLFYIFSSLGHCPHWTRTLLSYNSADKKRKKKMVCTIFKLIGGRWSFCVGFLSAHKPLFTAWRKACHS